MTVVFFKITKDPIMPDESEKGIDRRNLIMASIATVGGAAAVAVNASAANAIANSQR